MLSQAIAGSPIVVEGGVTATAGANEFDLGFDPNADPELALALRVSLEEQRHRQEEEARRAKQGVQETQSAPATAGGIMGLQIVRGYRRSQGGGDLGDQSSPFLKYRF